MYALYAAVAEDCIRNMKKLSQIDHNLKSTSKTNHSTPLTVHLSLHDEDSIRNTNKLSQLDHKLKSTTKKNQSTLLTVHSSLHDASPCPPDSLIDVSNPTNNMEGIHDPEFCVLEVVISTPLQIPSELKIFNSASDTYNYPQVLGVPFSFPVHLQCPEYIATEPAHESFLIACLHRIIPNITFDISLCSDHGNTVSLQNHVCKTHTGLNLSSTP